jgi:hypothetical protein
MQLFPTMYSTKRWRQDGVLNLAFSATKQVLDCFHFYEIKSNIFNSGFGLVPLQKGCILFKTQEGSKAMQTNLTFIRTFSALSKAPKEYRRIRKIKQLGC